MKKLIFFSVLIVSIFMSCQKDEFGLSKVDTIVIKGRFLSSETGEPLSLATLSGVHGSNAAILQYRMPTYNKFQTPIIMRDKVSADGSYEFYVDSVSAFIQKQGINFVGYAPNHTNCDTNMNRCSKEPIFKMPFSVFEQKQIGTTLFLTYNIKLVTLASLNFEIKGLVVNDSVSVNYDVIFPCTGSVYTVNSGNKVSFPTLYRGLGGFIPNRNYKIIMSKFRDNKRVKTYEWEGKLEPREVRQIAVDMN